jgi:predicted RNA-binding protein associated with RNAse of E/G family
MVVTLERAERVALVTPERALKAEATLQRVERALKEATLLRVERALKEALVTPERDLNAVTLERVQREVSVTLPSQRVQRSLKLLFRRQRRLFR